MLAYLWSLRLHFNQAIWANPGSSTWRSDLFGGRVRRAIKASSLPTANLLLQAKTFLGKCLSHWSFLFLHFSHTAFDLVGEATEANLALLSSHEMIKTKSYHPCSIKPTAHISPRLHSIWQYYYWRCRLDATSYSTLQPYIHCSNNNNKASDNHWPFIPTVNLCLWMQLELVLRIL